MITQVKVATACAEMMDSFRLHLEGQLAAERSAELVEHLNSCKACRAEFDAQKRVIELLGQTYESKRISESFDEAADRKLNLRRQTPNTELVCLTGNALPQASGGAAGDVAMEAQPEARSLTARIVGSLGAAPWWMVSASLHILVIALASLVSMAIEMPQNDDSVIMITELAPRLPVQMQEEPKKPQDALDSSKEVPATDPNSKEASDIVVPPDILAKAELGDHFETINLDRPDTHSAYGVEDAKMFHSVSGNADAAGGGGMDGLNLDDTIGYGGAASKGKGGGWGGGEGTGIGVNNGGGKGSFGNRSGGGRKLMIKRNGGTPATEGAVDRGLEWLARNQEADGHWDSIKHGGGKDMYGNQGKLTDVAVTGFAVLAFLGAGNTEKTGKYKENVVKGIAWLISNQDEKTGLLAINYGYCHAIAGMALAEAAGMAHIDATKAAAQKAVDCTCYMQHGTPSDKSGWSYVRPTYDPKEENPCGDLSNSGWHMMFLKSAKVAGLKVPTLAIEGIHRYLASVERGRIKDDPYSGHKYVYTPDNVEEQVRPTRCSIGLLCELFFGANPMELESGYKYMVETGKLPQSGLVADGAWKDGAGHDLYYIYYGTLGAFQMGGDLWKNWNEALKKAIPPLQVKGGADDGSWNPRGEYCDKWGRVGQTALSILCMEVYYRYAKLSGN